MDSGDNAKREDHLREVERVMMYIDQAGRKAEDVAAALAKDGAEDRIVAAIRTAAGALRAEHNRLLNSTHFTVPDEAHADRPDPEADDAAEDAAQQRMAL